MMQIPLVSGNPRCQEIKIGFWEIQPGLPDTSGAASSARIHLARFTLSVQEISRISKQIPEIISLIHLIVEVRA